MKLPRAHGALVGSAVFRQQAEDFQVDEQLGFEPDGEGEHVYLHVRKRNTNTQWLARELTGFAGLKSRDVSYAGLKDRHAVTTQWFSLNIHKSKEPDWQALDIENIEVLSSTRHRCKLRQGMAKQNHFRITLRDADFQIADLEKRIDIISQQGVPNYFGEQRFGIDEGNLAKATALFRGEIRVKDRKKKGIYLSAARSFLFNKVLAERVSQGSWCQALSGDCMMLDGSNSFFHIEQVDDEIRRRLSEVDIHPSGPMWGKGDPLVTDQVLALEDKVLADEEIYKDGLVQVNMKMERRSLRLFPQGLGYELLDDGALVLCLSLSSGQYATTVLQELFELKSAGLE